MIVGTQRPKLHDEHSHEIAEDEDLDLRDAAEAVSAGEPEGDVVEGEFREA